MSGAGIRIDTSTYFDPQNYGREYPNCSAASFTSNGSLVALFKAGDAGLAIVFPSGIRGPDEVKTFRLTGSQLNGRNRRVEGFVVSPLGHRAAVYDEDRHVFLWDTPGFTNHIKLEHQLKQTAFSPDGLLLAGIFSEKTVCIFSVEDNSFIYQIVLQEYCHSLSISRGFICILSPNKGLSIIDYDGVELHATHPGDRVNLDRLFFEAGGSRASHFARRAIGVSPSRIWTVSGRTSTEGTTAWTAPSARANRWLSLAEVSDDGWLQVSFDTLTTDWATGAETLKVAYTPLCWLPPSRRPPSKAYNPWQPAYRPFHVDYITWSGPRIIVIGESGIVTILDCSAHPLFHVPPATS
ncbi:hypothetical protein BKA62DRAFT_836829 [Auriculariales sp. MPI-PUGE-AT-0066]|nr:hypothetical protein BKA62DRAFT_836829 [Auriculariales sp. MPI-PUGE-AT-0066]